MFFGRIALALAIVEMIAFAVIIGEIGFWATLGLWALSALIGGWLMQEQGMATFKRAQAAFERGILPMDELFESLCLFAAGALLILPGFVSDVFAFALLVPSFRNLLRSRGGKSFGLKDPPAPAYEDGVIDGVYERVPERTEQIPPKNPEKQGPL